MRIGITGYRGRVGKSFVLFPNVFPLDCDITNPLQIQHAIKYVKPDLVVHLAAKSDVDYCEMKSNEIDVIDVNFLGVANVAEQVEKYGCGMVLLSSDHVFSGKKWFGKYSEKDKPSPINFYGMSKTAAEGLKSVYDNFKVVRTSTLFNPQRIFLEIKKMEETNYPVFMKRSFIYLSHFCNLLYDYCQRFEDMPKILHLAGVDSVSYYEFMSDLADHWNISGEVKPRRKELPETFAPRGHNLGLDVSLAIKLGFHRYSYLDGIREITR